MSLASAPIWTALSTLIKIGAGLLMVKVLAVVFGPDGVGQAGNFRQLITVLGTLSGAGIFNGMTKLVAQHQHQPDRLRAVLGTGSAMVLASSLLLAAMFIFAAEPVSRTLFGHEQYRDAVVALAVIQLGIACANLGLAILKGYRDVAGNALAVSVGSLLGVAAFFVCYRLGGYVGALAGLALLPAMALLPVLFMLCYRRQLPLSFLLPAWDGGYAALLAKFTVMAFITAMTLQAACVIMRNLLARTEGWAAVGIWQGVSSISDAYLQFITTSFTVYLLPTLSRLNDKRSVAREITRALRFVLPAVSTISLTLWLLRDVAIRLLFSAEFSAMSELFAWQLVGDVLKVGAYVFGYLVLARAALRVYLLAEISQFVLLIGFSHWLIPCHGALGAAQAYMATYIVYFALCSSVFLLYLRKNEQFNTCAGIRYPPS
ncbi:MAG: Lipid III flippase [Sodalis sp.]|uniref:lipid III flippase WzxE n=1 Tax=Sodalis sp. (in: enterobacteria) TaxID=1898979 RepID=UPI003873376D|nr:MAG: Lipid III flippase [Sodalis sp.]